MLIKLVDFQELSAEMRSKFDKLTSSPFNINKDDICVAFAASEDSNPIGLIFSFVYPLSKEASVASFFVDPDHRHRGIGSQLMIRLLEHLKGMNIKLFTLNYSDKSATTPYLEKILQKTGWAPSPKVILRRYFLDQYSFHPDWFFSPFPSLPQDCSLFLWRNATTDDIQQARIWDRENSLTALYSPFRTRYPIEEINSLGIRWKGTIAGWMIVQRVDPKHIIYSGLYIIPELRGMGPSINLLKEAIRRHLNHEIDTVGIVEINGEVSPPYWIRFIEKRLAPFAFQIETILSAYKIDQ